MNKTQKVGISLPTEVLTWLDNEVDVIGRWPSRSNAITQALEHLRRFHTDPLQV